MRKVFLSFAERRKSKIIVKLLTVDKENDTVCYNDRYHVYWDKRDLFTYISVTTLIGLYEQEFNREFWLQYKAFQQLCEPNPDVLRNLRELMVFDRETLATRYRKLRGPEFDELVAEIDSKWKTTNKDACEKGTKIHAGFENKFDSEGYYNLSWYGFDRNSKYLYKPGCYKIDMDVDKQAFPEMLISMKTKSGVRVAGQIDLAVKDGKDIFVIDYKSNAKLRQISYLGPNGYSMMKSPLSHLMDCNMVHYQLQLTMYQYMLMRKYRDLEPNDLTIIHVSDREVVRHILKYIPKDVISMCCHFRDFRQDYEYTKIIKDEQGRYWLPR